MGIRNKTNFAQHIDNFSTKPETTTHTHLHQIGHKIIQQAWIFIL